MSVQFSVIIPAYNAEKTLERCLDSLMRQISGYSVELIIINDGSADRTESMILEYQKKHSEIRYYYQENAGVSAARNKGLEKANGEYISFVDSDDYVLDNYFSNLLSVGDADLAVFPYLSQKSSEIVKCERWLDLIQGNTIEKINGVIYSLTSFPWNKRFKRELILAHQIRFDPALYLGEDFLFTLEYMMSCKSVFASDQLLYCVDESGNDSLTRKEKHDFFSQQLIMYRKAFGIIDQADWSEAEKAALLQTLDYIFCRTAFACAEDALESSEKNTISTVRLLTDEFHNVKQKHVRSLNAIHWIMQYILENKISIAVLMVAHGHCILKRKRH